MSTDNIEIVDVEHGEAEWTLKILLSLYEHYIVKPAEYAERRKKLNSKLQDQGKHGMKS
jgi:hypothetical protein